MSRFDLISPLDYRYIPDDKAAQYLSETARIRYQARVEAALAETLAEFGVCSQEIADEITHASQEVTPEAVYEEEKRIRHDVRALANIIRSKVGEAAKPYVHFGATSYDIVDTASALRYKEASTELLIPALKDLERALIQIAEQEAETLQIGRTHGQHAEPITFGFAVAEYVSRLGGRIQAIEHARDALPGKFSGAVGSYNATSLFLEDPGSFERSLLKRLGLQPGTHSTQIVEPEPLTDLLHAYTSCFGVLANFADDLRALQRSELQEVSEHFDARQVGSSTMPHKRNPVTFENIKSLWKAFMPRMNTVYLDQISEHQRDLTNSASARFIPELLYALYGVTRKLTVSMKKMKVDAHSLEKNFRASADWVVAEPLYLLLAANGHPDAHEYVRSLTLEAQQKNQPLSQLIKSQEDGALKVYFSRFTPSQKKVLQDPSRYTGKAAEKARAVCGYWKKELNLE